MFAFNIITYSVLFSVAVISATPIKHSETNPQLEGSNAVSPKNIDGSRIVNISNSTTTSASTSAKDPDTSSSDSIYYEDEIVGAFNTVADEELSPQVATHERVNVATASSSTWVNPEIAAAFSLSSSMLIIQNSYSNGAPLSVKYISPSDPNIYLNFITVIMKARGIGSHIPNVDYTTVVNNRPINWVHGSGNYFTIDIRQFCGVFDIIVYEAQTIYGQRVNPNSVIARVQINCGVQY